MIRSIFSSLAAFCLASSCYADFELINNGGFTSGANGWTVVNTAGTFSPAVFSNAMGFNRANESVFGDYIEQEFIAPSIASTPLAISLRFIEFGPASNVTHQMQVEIIASSGAILDSRDFSISDTDSYTTSYTITPNEEAKLIRITNTAASNSGRSSDARVTDVSVRAVGDANLEISSSINGNIANGATDLQSTVTPDANRTITYTISNTGLVPLSISPVLTTAAQNLSNNLTSPSASVIPAGGSTNFQLDYTATTFGEFSLDFSLSNSDPNKNPFIFRMSGFAPKAVPIFTPFGQLLIIIGFLALVFSLRSGNRQH